MNIPSVSSSCSKIADTDNYHFANIFKNSDIAGNPKLISAAYSTASWRSMNSAWNIWILLCSSNSINPNSNLSSPIGARFIEWLYGNKKLKTSSIESYLSSISTVLKLKNLRSDIFDNFISNIMLKGGKMLEIKNFVYKPTRKVMTLDILKIIGHEISNSGWSDDSKRIFWSVSCTMFFGSFRIGELLSMSDTQFDPLSCLLWRDIKFEKDSVLIHIKIPKARNLKGDFIDIFRFQDSSCCPVRALKGLKKFSAFSKDDNKPVFTFQSGKILTPVLFNKTLRTLLHKHFGSIADEYSSHSFRAAISSALAKLPHLASEDEIKCWGRWESSAFKKYTRLRIDQRVALHKKVTTALLYRSA